VFKAAAFGKTKKNTLSPISPEFWRSKPLVFSFVPRCPDEYGSAKKHSEPGFLFQGLETSIFLSIIQRQGMTECPWNHLKGFDNR